MKILAVADEESKYLWEYYEPSKLRDIDLIIGCGDLSLHYMNFLSDAAPVPVLYVHGNHDASYDKEPPRGAICIDDDLYWYKGYRIAGLGKRIFHKRIKGLFGCLDAKLGLREHLNASVTEKGVKFTQFSFVAGRKYKFIHRCCSLRFGKRLSLFGHNLAAAFFREVQKTI